MGGEFKVWQKLKILLWGNPIFPKHQIDNFPDLFGRALSCPIDYSKRYGKPVSDPNPIRTGVCPPKPTIVPQACYSLRYSSKTRSYSYKTDHQHYV